MAPNLVCGPGKVRFAFGTGHCLHEFYRTVCQSEAQAAAAALRGSELVLGGPFSLGDECYRQVDSHHSSPDSLPARLAA